MRLGPMALDEIMLCILASAASRPWRSAWPLSDGGGAFRIRTAHSLSHTPSLPPSLARSLSLSLPLSLSLFLFGACGVSDVLPSFLLSGLSPPGGPGPRPPSPCLVGGRGLVESVVGAVPRGCFNVWRLLGAHPRPCTLTCHQASSPRPLRQGP